MFTPGRHDLAEPAGVPTDDDRGEPGKRGLGAQALPARPQPRQDDLRLRTWIGRGAEGEFRPEAEVDYAGDYLNTCQS